MYQLVKRCYIYGILIVHVKETNSILSDSILNKCYAVPYLHIVQFAIETVLSLSEMYHGTFTNQMKYNFLCRRLIKRATDKLNMHTYYLLSLYITCIFTICVSNDTNYCAFSIVHIIIISLAK